MKMSSWLLGFLAGSLFWMPAGFMLAALLSANGKDAVETPAPQSTPEKLPTGDSLLPASDTLLRE